MRRVFVLLAVLTLASFVSTNEVLAFSWRGIRYQNCHCRSAATVTHHKQLPAQTATPTTTATSKSAIQSDTAVEVDESETLVQFLDVMKAILKMESDRLDRELELLEEDDDSSYGSD